MKASLCPVCMGKGIIYGIAETGTMPTQTCHGCGGKGWVEVSDCAPFIPPDGVVRYSYPSVESPACGGNRNSPALTGCPKGSHYGAYCLG